ncbi:MAG: hypothetical protein WBY53_13885 [Acidobacteriaceae bacterium]
MNPEEPQPPAAPTVTSEPTPAQDTGFSARHLPGTPAGEVKGMLPGMAFIAMYLLLLAMLNAFAALHGIFGAGFARYGIFGICSLMVVGVFGFLRLRRWGWSIVAAGYLLLAAGDFYFYSRKHVGFFLIRALFSIVFFLYLSRTEVRERLH